jgi:hypothetical protein
MGNSTEYLDVAVNLKDFKNCEFAIREFYAKMSSQCTRFARGQVLERQTICQFGLR